VPGLTSSTAACHLELGAAAELDAEVESLGGVAPSADEWHRHREGHEHDGDAEPDLALADEGN
jgi:hypothetical protein